MGGNILSLELGGEDIYFSGQLPYVIPYYHPDKSQMLFDAPQYYRWIGHHAVPTFNQFLEFNPLRHQY